MKKFYSMAISALCALSAAAGPFALTQLTELPVQGREPMPSIQRALGPVSIAKAPAKESADAPESIVGKNSSPTTSMVKTTDAPHLSP